MSNHDGKTLRAIFNTLIPADVDPPGWEGGVQRLLDDHLNGFMRWSSPFLKVAIRLVDVASTEAGHGVFCQASEAQRHEIVAGLLASGEPALHELVKIAYLGFYAGTSEPAGWTIAGFAPIPPGVTAIDPDPVRDTPFDQIQPAYDVVVIGAGAGGGVIAAELSRAGKSVLIVERGRNHRDAELRGNHIQGKRQELYDVTAGPGAGNPRVLERDDGSIELLPGDGNGTAYGLVAMTVGGGTRLWQGMSWRFLPEDFAMASTYGVPEQSTLSDWPFGYDELAPYYDRVEWELGVSGDANSAAGRRVPRARPYPMPALGSDPVRIAFSAAAGRLGWSASPIPFAINSVPRSGRGACVHCAQCVGHTCPVSAKNGTQNTFIPRALETGACTLVTATQVVRIAHDGNGRATGVEVVRRSQEHAPESRLVRASVIVVSAGAIETARLLLVSQLGNSWVGRNHHTHGMAMAFTTSGSDLNRLRGPGHSVASLDHAHANGAPWGGGVMFDLPHQVPFWKAQIGARVAGSAFGAAHKDWMRTAPQALGAMSMVQEIPHAATAVRADPSVVDLVGMPVARIRPAGHPATKIATDYMADRCDEWLREVGGGPAERFTVPGGQVGAEHSAGTARMGSDPADAACDPTGLLFGTHNVYVADASLHPTNGGFNPGLTVMANAMRIGVLLNREMA